MIIRIFTRAMTLEAAVSFSIHEAIYRCKIVRQNGRPLVSVIGQIWSPEGHSSIIFQRIFMGMVANFN